MSNHVDPSAMPQWLLDEARKDSPNAMAWLVSGYLAGVEIGRAVSGCEASVTVRLESGLQKVMACGYAAGHAGAHDTIASIAWRDEDEVTAPPALPDAGASALSVASPIDDGPSADIGSPPS